MNVSKNLRIMCVIAFSVMTQLSISSQTKQDVEKTIDIIKHRGQYPNYVLVSAHRGYWADFPENSTEAYGMAITIGADIIEMDVRMTKDNEMVVFHDACLDRVTTGYGRLREENMSYVGSLYLKTEDGTATTSRVLKLSDALDFLKDKAVIALDIKETGRLFDATMIRVLKMLKSKRMLWQTIVKGKMRLSDLQNNILQPAALTLDDFIYTPIAFSTTADLSTYISEFVNTHKIYAMELVYKQSADPILNYLEGAYSYRWLVRKTEFPDTYYLQLVGNPVDGYMHLDSHHLLYGTKLEIYRYVDVVDQVYRWKFEKVE